MRDWSTEIEIYAKMILKRQLMAEMINDCAVFPYFLCIKLR